MKIFEKRPLALACFFFLASLALSFYVNIAFKRIIFFNLMLMLAFCTFLFIKLKQNRNKILSAALSFLFSALAIVLSYFAFDVGYYGFQKYVGTAGEITAVVKSISYRENFVSYLEVGVSRINGERVSTNMKLECSYRFPFEEGERFSAAVEFAALEENINGYHEKMVGISKGQSLVAFSYEIDDLVFLKGADSNLFLFSKKLNSKLDALLDDAIGAESSGLARALLLGNKAALGKQDERNIRCVGVSHLLALSGMHLSVMIGSIGYLLMILGTPKRPRLIILALLTVGYVVLTGMQLSMVRSALMLFVAYFGFFVGRNRDMLTSLFLSVTLICTVSPGAFFDVGLELSFLSMMGIVVFQEPLQNFFDRLFEKIKWDIVYVILQYTCMSLSVTFVATLSVLPAIWLYFGETSLMPLIGNFLLVPFVNLILTLSPLVILFNKIRFLGIAVSFCVGKLSDIMLAVCAFLSQNRGVMISLKYPFAPYIIFGVGAVIFIMLMVNIERKCTFIVPVAAGIAAFAICLGVYTNLHKGELNAVYMSDGYNEGFTVVSEGHMLICDISSGSYNFNATLVRAGKKLAVCDLETYMLTHYHMRHADTFLRLCNEIYVRNLLLPTPVDDEEYEISRVLVEIAKENGVQVCFYDWAKENRLSFESIKIDIGRRTQIKRSEQPITALSFINDNARLTYAGPSLYESDLYETFMPAICDSDAIVFGIHGPKIKSSFSYGALSPKLKNVLFCTSDILGDADLSDDGFRASLESAEISVDVSVHHFVFD